VRMSKWNDILVFIGYALLIIIPPVVFWYILLYCMVMVNLMDMFIGFMNFLRSVTS
jgi:hypothetical protein